MRKELTFTDLDTETVELLPPGRLSGTGTTTGPRSRDQLLDGIQRR